MAFGCFVDIRQQDGSLVRMHYEGTGPEVRHYIDWIGITEATTDKFNQGQQPRDTE